MDENKKFNSKILLFGEYGVIKNSMALAIPYDLFSGKLKFRANEKRIVDQELKAFAKYLRRLCESDELGFEFDYQSFEFDVTQGLYFNSTIPQGYGVGSSGALCASVYNAYTKDKEVLDFQSLTNEDVSQLKFKFSQMESHFHGSSSGADPLISYLNVPILINSDNSIKHVAIPDLVEGDGGIFLLNTGRERRTEPLVNLFLEKCQKPEFDKLCTSVLTPITNNCITSFLEGDIEGLYEFFRELSDFQYRHFTPMIPNLYRDLWLQGLKYEDYYLKLCGAGGGGFILGMTKNFKDAQESLSDYEIRPLFRF